MTGPSNSKLAAVLDSAEAAELLKMGRRSFLRAVADGRIPDVEIPLDFAHHRKFSRERLEAFAARRSFDP